MATYLLRNGILSVDGVAVLQAANSLGVFVLENIINAQKGDPYQNQSLTYLPGNQTWVDERGKIVLFNLAANSQIKLVSSINNPLLQDEHTDGTVLTPNVFPEYFNDQPLLLTDGGIPYITDLGNAIIIPSANQAGACNE